MKNEIVGKFLIEGTVEKVEPLGNGLINDTYKVTTNEADKPDYVLQRINHAIFQNVDLLQHNIVVVTAHKAASVGKESAGALYHDILKG